MFTFTKQQKLVKTLKNITTSYNKLTMGKALEGDSHVELHELHWEKEQIEKEKLALSYDTIKTEIYFFGDIGSPSHTWKLNKPIKSEGMIFIAPISDIHHYSTITDELNTMVKDYEDNIQVELDYINHKKIATFFKKAINKKFLKEESNKRRNHWRELTGQDYLPSKSAFLLSSLLQKLDGNVVFIEKPGYIVEDELEIIAKYTHTNIVIL